MEKVLKGLFAVNKVSAILQRWPLGQGFGFNDLMLLYYLNEADGGRLRRIDIAEKLGLTPSGVTRMILPLEKIGIIKREEGDGDARERFTIMTSNGKRMFSEVKSNLEEKLEDLIPSGKGSEFEKMEKLLEVFAE